MLATGAVVGAGVGLVPPQVTPAAISGSLDSDPGGGAPATVAEPVLVRASAAQAVMAPLPSDAVPADSGQGRRIVFSQERQRVWLIAADEAVERTYLVSGSVYDNLDPGSYSVFSRSEQAWGIDDSGTMRHFVRFARGPRAAIGFHDIPVSDGKAVQTEDELGQPLSHGCIRQRSEDAVALWEFAPLGTSVVVVA